MSDLDERVNKFLDRKIGTIEKIELVIFDDAETPFELSWLGYVDMLVNLYEREHNFSEDVDPQSTRDAILFVKVGIDKLNGIRQESIQ